MIDDARYLTLRINVEAVVKSGEEINPIRVVYSFVCINRV